MKSNSILILLVIIIFVGCGHSESNLPDISNANNIKLYYKMDFDSTGKQRILTKELTDNNKVQNIKEIISDDKFEYLYCTSSGSMSFYKDSTLLTTMVFNTDPGQLHIACNYNGKLTAVKLTEENAKFLESLKNQ